MAQPHQMSETVKASVAGLCLSARMGSGSSMVVREGFMEELEVVSAFRSTYG